MVTYSRNIGYFCSSKNFVEGKNDNMATVKGNMFLYKSVAISSKRQGNWQPVGPDRELGDCLGHEMRGKNIRLKMTNSLV
jgi:hypothetical protein